MGEVGVNKLASVLLQYPTPAVFDGLDHLDATCARIGPRGSRDALGRFLGWMRATSPSEVTQHYVETFDLRRRCALYLTYFRYGDTRNRGMAMLTFKAAYRGAGFVPAEDDLPDYLPVVLEFADLCPAGAKLLRAHRADLELLYKALVQAGTPYADVVAAVRAQHPRLAARDLNLVHTAWEAGPPEEQVGMEPFAPPGYLTGQRR